MTEMPDFGAFPEGGTFINDGTLMVPVTNICLHLLVLRKHGSNCNKYSVHFCRLSLLKAKATKHLSSERDFAIDRSQIAHDSIRVTDLID